MSTGLVLCSSTGTLIEKTETHILFFFFLFFRDILLLLLGSGGSTLGWGTGGLGGLGSSESLRIGQDFLDLRRSLESVAGLNGNGQDVLVGVSEVVGDGSNRWVMDLKGKGSDVLDTRDESSQEVRVGKVKNAGTVDESVVVHVGDGETIREGLDVQLAEKGGLRRSDLITSL